MVPDLQASLLCDDVRQEVTGKFILIGLFDGLVVSAVRPVCPRLCLVNRWCMGQGDFQERTRIVAPDGNTIVAEGNAVPIKLESEQQVITTVEIILNVTFRQPGTHWVEVMIDKELKMRYPLLVRFAVPKAPVNPA